MNFKKAEFGKYPDTWNLFKLEEVLTILTDYHSNGSYKKLKENVELLDNEEYAIMIRTTNFEQDSFSKDSFKYINEHAYNFLSKSKVRPKDILMNKIANAGTVYIVPNLDKPVSLAMNLFLLRFNEEIVLQEYAYYFLKTNEEYVKTRAQGSVTKTITKKNVNELQIAIPSLFEQKKIINILSTIDTKINLNKKIIVNLENLINEIFKNWFIDFEFLNEQGLPYRASGGEMVQSELGEIPKNFTISNFESLISETIGGDWGKDSTQGNYTCDVSILRGADIPEVKVGKSGKVPKRYILEKNYLKKKLLNGDVVIEISGGSPTQSTGRVTYINREILDRYQDKLLCTNFCRVMRPKIPQIGIFIYIYFNYLYNENLFFSYENGTTGIKNFDVNSFIQVYSIPMPTEELIIKFNEVIEKYYKLIQELGNENMKLEKLRDTLLPKLLSGETKIPNESVVESS